MVAPKNAALPPRCVHTNVEVSGDGYRTRELPFTPTWLLPGLLVFSPAFLLILAPMVQGTQCKMRFALSPPIQRKYRVRRLLVGLMIPAGFLLPIPLILLSGGSLIGTTAAIVLFFVCFYGGFALLHYWASPLRIVRIKPDEVWVKGCSSDFMQSLLKSSE